MAKQITTETEGLTLDLILTNLYGFEGQNLIDEAIKLNPHLGAVDLALPFGTKITLPDKPVSSVKEVEVVDFFEVD